MKSFSSAFLFKSSSKNSPSAIYTITYNFLKGKEYSIDYCDQVKLLFEGEYLNNKRNGKGKEYFSEGNVKFEGNI